jgi:hypothetical protein
VTEPPGHLRKTRNRQIPKVNGSVTPSSSLKDFEACRHRGSTTGNGTSIVVKDRDDVSPGKDHSEFEGELFGLVKGAELAPVGGSAGLVKKKVAPLLLNARDFVV